MSDSSIENRMSVLLYIGVLVSSLIVLIGGVLYLIQHGMDNVQIELLQSATKTTSVKNIWLEAFSFTPLGIVQLGLLLLVCTQLLRVALLLVFYLSIRDYWFVAFCGFVLSVLLYTFL
jgi:uncharacterized membrane protein